MMAMSLLLTAPLRALKLKYPRAGWMLYVDDRTWVAPTARMCVAIGNDWRSWSWILGLRENESKDQYHRRTVGGRRPFLAAGVAASKISPSPRIRGVVLVPARQRRSFGAECHRLKAAGWTLKRVQCLPIPLSMKTVVAAVSGVSKASFGWTCRLPTLVETRRLDWKVALACRVARQSDPSLRRILLGHHASLEFRSACDQVMALWRCVKQGEPLPGRSGFWAKTVHKSMLRLGWTLADAPWRWRSDVGILALDPNDLNFEGCAAKLAHLIRES